MNPKHYGQRGDDAPRCHCLCHVDYDGPRRQWRMYVEDGQLVSEQVLRPYVGVKLDRPVEAAIACPTCRDLHDPVFSSHVTDGPAPKDWVWGWGAPGWTPELDEPKDFTEDRS